MNTAYVDRLIEQHNVMIRGESKRVECAIRMLDRMSYYGEGKADRDRSRWHREELRDAVRDLASAVNDLDELIGSAQIQIDGGPIYIPEAVETHEVDA